MRFLLVGDYRDNNGPNNVNKEIIRYKSKNFSHVCMTNRFWKYQDAVLKLLCSDVVVVSGTSKLNLFVMKTAKRLGKKTAYIMHGCAAYEARINHQVLSERDIIQEEELLEYTDLILAVSEKYCQWVKNHFPQHAHKTDFWQLGVTWHRSEIRDHCHGTTVAAAGGSLPLKRNRIVSDAVESLGGTARLMVYGPTNGDSIPSAQSTQWVGEVTHDAFLDGLRAADVFVVNSVVESFNIAVMEALSCGCSVLVSNHVGAAGLLDLTENDIIFNVEDENEIAEKISYLLQYPNNRRICEKLDWNELSYEKAVARLEEICRKLGNSY